MPDTLNPGPEAGTIAGLDGHLRTCNLCGINTAGVIIRRFRNLPTTAEALTEAIRCFPRPVILIAEESTLAHWFLTLFRPLVDRVVVVDPKRNRLISEATILSTPTGSPISSASAPYAKSSTPPIRTASPSGAPSSNTRTSRASPPN